MVDMQVSPDRSPPAGLTLPCAAVDKDERFFTGDKAGSASILRPDWARSQTGASVAGAGTATSRRPPRPPRATRAPPRGCRPLRKARYAARGSSDPVEAVEQILRARRSDSTNACNSSTITYRGASELRQARVRAAGLRAIPGDQKNCGASSGCHDVHLGNVAMPIGKGEPGRP